MGRFEELLERISTHDKKDYVVVKHPTFDYDLSMATEMGFDILNSRNCPLGRVYLMERACLPKEDDNG